MVFLNCFNYSSKLHHNLFHSLKQLVIIFMIWFIRQPLNYRRLIFEYTWKVHIFRKKCIFYTSQLHLEVQIFLLKSEHFKSLLFTIITLRWNNIWLMRWSLDYCSAFKFFLLLISLHINHQFFIDVSRVLFSQSFILS
jgi:hypothetical protein